MIILPFLPQRIKTKMKLPELYWVLVGILLSFISVTTATYADMETYTNIFNWTNYYGVNYDTIGWSFLCKCFYMMGFNYRGMIPFVIFLSVFLIDGSCRKLHVPEDEVLSLLLVFPGLMNVIQLKFFLAISVVVYSLTFLQRPSKYGVLKYLLGTTIATMIHSASLFCFIFVMTILIRKKDMVKPIVMAIITILLVIVFLRFIPVLAGFFMNEEKITRYFTGAVEVSSLKWIVEISIAWMLMVIVSWLVITVCSKSSKSAKKSLPHLNEECFIARSFFIVFLCGASLPLLIYDESFHRFVELEYIVGYFILSYYKKNKRPHEKIDVIIITSFLLLSLLFCMRYFVTFDKVIPMFHWNGFVVLRR